MRISFIVFAGLIALASGNALKLPDFEKPCAPPDTRCCEKKLKIFGGLLLKGLADLVIRRFDVSYNYGCCNLRVIAQNTTFADFSGVVLNDFLIDLRSGIVELDLEIAEFNISTTHDVMGKCVDLPVSSKGCTRLQLDRTKLKLIVEFRIRAGRLKLVSVDLKPTYEGLYFILNNSPNDRLQRLLNQSPLAKILVIFGPVFDELYCSLENVLFEKLAKLIDDLPIDLFLII